MWNDRDNILRDADSSQDPKSVHFLHFSSTDEDMGLRLCLPFFFLKSTISLPLLSLSSRFAPCAPLCQIVDFLPIWTHPEASPHSSVYAGGGIVVLPNSLRSVYCQISSFRAVLFHSVFMGGLRVGCWGQQTAFWCRCCDCQGVWRRERRGRIQAEEGLGCLGCFFLMYWSTSLAEHFIRRGVCATWRSSWRFSTSWYILVECCSVRESMKTPLQSPQHMIPSLIYLMRFWC